jgi:hypothetical protein
MECNFAADEQTRTKKKVARFLAISAVLFLSLLAYAVYWLFYDLERIPRGELLAEATSPDGIYTVRVYRSDAGATTAFSTVGELIENQSQKKKTMYFQYRESKAEIVWLDGDTVVINGRTLDVPDDGYDYRRH